MSDKEEGLLTIQQSMANRLWELESHKREKVLEFCADNELFAPVIFSADILNMIVTHIVEIGREWKWL